MSATPCLSSVTCLVLHVTCHMSGVRCQIKIIIKKIEEVPVKRMDRPCATETERGRASETDRRKSAKKHGNATELDQM